MAKDIYTELREGMKDMAKEELNQVIESIEADKMPSIPMTPGKVMRKVYEIACQHKMTAEEFATILALQGTAGVAESVAMLEEYKKSLEEE